MLEAEARKITLKSFRTKMHLFSTRIELFPIWKKDFFVSNNENYYVPAKKFENMAQSQIAFCYGNSNVSAGNWNISAVSNYFVQFFVTVVTPLWMHCDFMKFVIYISIDYSVTTCGKIFQYALYIDY
jgi:hypothetical protein